MILKFRQVSSKWNMSNRSHCMAGKPKYHEESVPAESAEEEQVIENLIAQGWMLYARADHLGKAGYVRLLFKKPDPALHSAE